MNSDEKQPVRFDDAVAALPNGNKVHTFRQGPFTLIGADWSRAELVKTLRNAETIERSGPLATKMHHALVIFDEHGPLFIETKGATK